MLTSALRRQLNNSGKVANIVNIYTNLNAFQLHPISTVIVASVRSKDCSLNPANIDDYVYHLFKINIKMTAGRKTELHANLFSSL